MAEKTPSFLNFLKSIPTTKPILISGHIRPDGDSIGSQIALTRILRQSHFESYMAYDIHTCPQRLQSFIEDTPILNILDNNNITDFTLIAVDTADRKRLPEPLQKHSIFALFDHHRSTRPYATYNFIIPDAPSTTDILSHLFLKSSLPIDKCTAQALYLGLLTDTGQFSYNSTTAETLQLAAYLIEQGANPTKITTELFENETLNRLTLRQQFLQTLQLERDGTICVGILSTELYKKTNTQPEDAEGFVDYTRMIKGVQIGALIESSDNQIKVSLRTRYEKLSLDQLATQFGGGGHACAAGFTIQGKLLDFYPTFLQTLDKYLKQHTL